MLYEVITEQLQLDAVHEERAVLPHDRVPLQEGAALSFVVTASDPDGQAIASLTASPQPPGSSFTPNATNTSGSRITSYNVCYTKLLRCV